MVVLNMEQDMEVLSKLTEDQKVAFMKAFSRLAGAEIINAVKTIDNRRAALELIKEMCVLAHADDELSDQETLLIGRVGQAMGVELEKIEQISNWIIDRIIWLEQAKIIFEEVK